MAQVFNPWKDPPGTGTLTGDFASIEINDMEGPDEAAHDMPASEHADAMAQALQVISQQAELIAKLMATLSK
jgi:hypothetical protein